MISLAFHVVKPVLQDFVRMGIENGQIIHMKRSRNVYYLYLKRWMKQCLEFEI